MIKFEAGKTYWTRSVCDYDCIIEAEIISRTDKTVKAKLTRGEKTFRVQVWDDVEVFSPWGRYSMSPTMTADRPRGN